MLWLVYCPLIIHSAKHWEVGTHANTPIYILNSVERWLLNTAAASVSVSILATEMAKLVKVAKVTEVTKVKKWQK